ncbi:GHMP kinase, partial [bacterium]|nr:GHMP kinase [bacterium]
FMDFAKEHFEAQDYGSYEELDVSSLPSLYIAYRNTLSEGTEIFHNDIRSRFNRQEPEIMAALDEWADLAQQTRDLLVAGKGNQIGPLLDRNFDLRMQTYQLSRGNLAMIEAARAAGASSKFTGSGGAIVGTYEGEEMFSKLKGSLEAQGCQVFKPQIAPDSSYT